MRLSISLCLSIFDLSIHLSSLYLPPCVLFFPASGAIERRSLTSTGQLIEEHHSSTVEFRNVDVVTPGGSVLLEGVSFAMTPGKNVFLLGPNGCGKTSLFRILGKKKTERSTKKEREI